jgi:hypothetical protein
MNTYFNLRFSKTLRYCASVIALAAAGSLVTISGVHAVPGFQPLSKSSNDMVVRAKNGITSGTFGGGLTIVKPKTQSSTNNSNTKKNTSNKTGSTGKQIGPSDLTNSPGGSSQLEPN